MQKRICAMWMLLLAAVGGANAQYRFLTEAPPAERLPRLWRYCAENRISDKDSATTCAFLERTARLADSLGDAQLKMYATYFRRCFRLLFSADAKQYFPPGDYKSPIAIFQQTKAWALKAGYPDIAAACEHYIGEAYFYEAKYGPAFEHLLRAAEEFQKIGYERVPGIALYLYDLGLAHYRFEEWDKALGHFLTASRYSFYLSRPEISTANSIGLIYAAKREPEKAALFYRKTVALASAYGDTAWVGIGYNNLGNLWMSRGNRDSAFYYHRKNYLLNSRFDAPEDAARSALVIAGILTEKSSFDSALHYIRSGEALASGHIYDPARRLDFHHEMLAALTALERKKGNYKSALVFTDSLARIKDSLQRMLDNNIVSQATAMADRERYTTELKWLDGQRTLGQYRFYGLLGLALFAAVTGGLLFNRYRLRRQRQAELAQKEKELAVLEKRAAEEKLKNAEDMLAVYVSAIREKAALVEKLESDLQRIKEEGPSEKSVSVVAANVQELVSSTILTEEDWQHFRTLFENVHPGFLYRLRERYPELSPAEVRLLILTKLNLSSREMAGMLGVSMETIRKSRYRLRKKLHLAEEHALEDLILEV